MNASETFCISTANMSTLHKCIDCKHPVESDRAYFEEVSWKRKGEGRTPYKRTFRVLCFGCFTKRKGLGEQGRLG
jgi:hypothetical protein